MKILAVECSDKPVSCAVIEDGELVCESFLSVGTTHSQTLQPMLCDMLKNSGVSIDRIDRFAVSVGPGSFTGLRIGIAAVKGMAYGLSKPCVGVSTLHAAAFGMVSSRGIICAVMDARCGQVYTATFYSDGHTLTRLCDDRAIMLTELTDDLKKLRLDEKYSAQTIFIVGRGANMCYNSVKDEMKNVQIAPPHLLHQRAAYVALVSGEYDEIPAEQLLPSYLRLPQAERELKAKGELKR